MVPTGCSRRHDPSEENNEGNSHGEEGTTRFVLSVLVELKQEGNLFIALTPPFSVSLEIDRTVLRSTLSAHELDEGQFNDAADEIKVILVNLLNSRARETQEVVQQIARQLGISPEEDAEFSRIAADTQAVRDQLCDNTLQRRYDLKRSSKAPSFNHVDWDIKKKYYDANLDSFSPFPYATFRISFQRDFDDSPFAVLGGRTFDSVQVNFSKDEIEHLARVLLTVKERLEQLEMEED